MKLPREKPLRVDDVRQRIEESLLALDRGEGRPADLVFARLEERIANLERGRPTK